MSNPRGADTTVKIMIDGEVEAAITDIVSSDFDPALEQQVDEYLGRATPTVSGTNGAPSITLTFHPSSPGAMALMNLQRKKNSPVDSTEEVEGRERTIDVSREVRFPGGSRVRILLPGCTMSGASQSAGSRTDKVSWSVTMTADKWVPLRLGA